VINVENEVFSTVSTALRAEYPNMNPLSGARQPAPEDLPVAVGMEMDNSTYQRTLDSSGTENHATVMWQWEAYSNKMPGKKAECKAIMEIIDTQMFNMGFLRVGSGPMEMPNANQTIYRMVARYRAVISKDKMVYRR
jgi:hypothetical protein